MLDNYDAIIRKNASVYIEEMCNACGNMDETLRFYPLTEYLLSSVLLRLTGFIEQKLDILQLILCNMDGKVRYNLLRKSHALSSNYDTVNSIYITFSKIINKLECDYAIIEKMYKGKSLFDNRECIYDAFSRILDLFKNSAIIYQRERHFKEFFILSDKILTYREKIAKLQKILKNVELSKSERKQYGTQLNVLVKKKRNLEKTHNTQDFLLTNDFINIYNQTIQFRHTIAHNINSVQIDLPSISYVQSPEFKYENYFIRFMIILSVDMIFRDMYEYYSKLKRKFLL